MLLAEPNIIVRGFCLVFGIIVMCFGSAFYMTAMLGVSTYDAIAIVITANWKRAKFQYIRIGTDSICVILGIILFIIGNGKWIDIKEFVGIGTIITAFFMGPLIQFFNEKIAMPCLSKY